MKFIAIATDNKMMRITGVVPPMPPANEAARFLHSRVLRYPTWRTKRQANRNPWANNHRADYLDQLERRSPHWPYVPVAQRATITGQITRLANLLDESQLECADLFGLDDATILYLRHGTTWRPLTTHSDVDLVAVIGNGAPTYTERRIPWGGINQPSRIWHIGYIGLDNILDGCGQEAMHVKMDLYRGICLFGEDIFNPADQPPPQAWLAFANQFMGYGLNYLERPEGYWVQKAALRFQEAAHILKHLSPLLDTDKFEGMLAEVKRGKPFLPNEFFNEGLKLLWECYHRLAASFPGEL